MRSFFLSSEWIWQTRLSETARMSPISRSVRFLTYSRTATSRSRSGSEANACRKRSFAASVIAACSGSSEVSCDSIVSIRSTLVSSSLSTSEFSEVTSDEEISDWRVRRSSAVVPTASASSSVVGARP